MPSSISVEKLWFGLSFFLLIFLYGIGVGHWKWFPFSEFEEAVGQARAVGVLPVDPHFVHPRPYERQGTRLLKPDDMQEGLTLLSTNWKEYGWGAALKLIDANGRTVHSWRVDPAQLGRSVDHGPLTRNFAAPHGLALFPNGDVVVGLRGVGELVRLDACGDVIWRLPTPADRWDPHHSIFRAENGTLWVSGRRPTTPDQPGLRRFDTISEDLIVHVSADGTVLQKTSVIDLLWENDLQRYVAKQFEHGVDPNDLTHLNDIEPLPAPMADAYPLFEAGDLAVSLRRPDLILVFDPDTDIVKWHAASPFINQHDPDFIGGGWIGVLNNNQDFTETGSMLGGSEVLALQPHTDSVEVRFPSAQSDSFYTSTAGEWQHLDNGNMLLTATNAGRVVEVNPKGETVWEWINTTYGDDSVTEVFDAKRYPLTSTEISSWPCSSEPSAKAPPQ